MARPGRDGIKVSMAPAFMLEYDAGGRADFVGVGLMTTRGRKMSAPARLPQAAPSVATRLRLLVSPGAVLNLLIRLRSGERPMK
jgi:hypothetical protein